MTELFLLTRKKNSYLHKNIIRDKKKIHIIFKCHFWEEKKKYQLIPNWSLLNFYSISYKKIQFNQCINITYGIQIWADNL